jgi:hypothetical protein
MLRKPADPWKLSGDGKEPAFHKTQKADPSACAPEVSIPLEGKVPLGDGLRMTRLGLSEWPASADALRVAPQALNNFCSSPDWYISPMMSEPPTNSPLT